MSDVQISVVIPVYNEQANLPTLMQRLIAVMEGMSKRYEIILVDDGSTDNSGGI